MMMMMVALLLPRKSRPQTDIQTYIHRIVEFSEYDGFGCINFKFAPNKYVAVVKSSSVNIFYVPI